MRQRFKGRLHGEGQVIDSTWTSISGAQRKPTAVPKDLVADFFGVFSRCEFAMKDTHLYERADGGRSAPAWRALANDAAAWLRVTPGSDLDRAIDALTVNPPRVQLLGGAWVAEPLPGAGRVAQAVNAATRVRNNLFHGGKHTAEATQGRDEELVRSALTLLLAVMEYAPPALRGAYGHV